MTHYFSKQPETPHAYDLFSVTCEGKALIFMTDSAVFSRRRIDQGTELLLNTVLSMEDNRKANVLDLGTGTGVLAVALARCRSSFQVTGSDINERAVQLATQNAKRNGVLNASFLCLDGVPENQEPFDLIVTNPPIRAGKKVVYRLFEEAAKNLRADGAFYTVIRVRQGKASVARELQNHYSVVETVARAKGYHVLRATRPIRKSSVL
ncbi:MAG: class I SAM-dependent methyltransferase [Clostridiaceae bacterium]|nr:class I SAM-dependent methyltransferase [Clostridiaceae bacterium]